MIDFVLGQRTLGQLRPHQPRGKSARPRVASAPHPSAPASAAPAAAPAAAPVAVAQSRLTLRQRYPFLNEPDCPAELHALVGHRISRYNEYSALYPQLRRCSTLEQCADVAGRLIDAYLDNRSCTAELDYYQRHRRLLGRHPYLKQWRQLSTLRAKTTRELIQEQQRCRDNIWRAKREIEKGTKPHLNDERRRRIQEYELKLQEIGRLLGEDKTDKK